VAEDERESALDSRQTAPRFSISELVDASGISDRTIRYYIQQGLLQHAHGRGRSSYYTTEHLERLARIADLRDRGLSLSEILEAVATPPGVEDLEVESWDRVSLHPELEVHIRAGASDDVRMLVDRFQQLAEQWFGALETGSGFREH
jgi:DNA-binding transcriptional MerR regulator